MTIIRATRPWRWGRATLSAGLLLALWAGSLAAQTDSTRLRAALARYESLVVRMRSDSIAAMFTPDGALLSTGRPPIIGPGDIQDFLESFRAFQVLADTMRVTDQTIWADSALQHGTFWQQVRVPAGDTVIAQGGFEILWRRQRDGRWGIARMGTAPHRPPGS